MSNELQQYIVTALWSSNDDAGKSLMESGYSLSDKTIESMSKDLDLFFSKAGSLVDGLNTTDVAHDFWLTRNRHGAGFWDGDYPEKIGEALTQLARSFGEVDLYVGDDGKIYQT